MIEQRLVSLLRTAHPSLGNTGWNGPQQRLYLQAQRQTATVALASSALATLILTLGVLPGL